MSFPTIPYGRQNITTEDIKAVVDTLQSDFLTQGPKVLEFEQNFARYVDAKYAIAVSNGTAALHLSVIAKGFNPGQKVITTPITFAASANSILYSRGEVDLIDIDPETFLIDLNLLEEKLKNSKKGEYAGIIPVAFSGLPVNMEQLKNITDKYNLWVIEDASHAPGASFKDSNNNIIKSGSNIYSDLTCFSFHPVKHIACGEGGMITTNNKVLYDKILKLRTHGITKNPDFLNENHGGWYYEMQDLGFNYRLPDINCALGNSQLKNADTNLSKRIEIARKYDKALSSLNALTIQKQPQNFKNAYHLYVVRVQDKRKEFYEFLRIKGILCQIHYIPVHYMPYYQNLGFKKGDFPNAEKYYNECISLPLFPTLKESEFDYIIMHIFDFFNHNK